MPSKSRFSSRRTIRWLIPIVFLAGAFAIWRSCSAPNEKRYTTVAVTKGNVSETGLAVGTICRFAIKVWHPLGIFGRLLVAEVGCRVPHFGPQGKVCCLVR